MKFVWLALAVFGLADVGRAEAKAFWERQSPSTYSHRLSKKILRRFPKLDLDPCKKELEENPKAFVKGFDLKIKRLSLLTNLQYDSLRAEGIRLKGEGQSSKSYKAYLQWLIEVSQALYEVENYHGLSPVLLTLAAETKLDPIELKFNLTVMPKHNEELGFFFQRFVQRVSSQKWEDRMVKDRHSIVPNLANLRIELEHLAGENFSIEPEVRAQIEESVCARLSSVDL